MDDRLLVLQMTAWMEEHLTDTGMDLIKVSGYSENRLRQKFYNVTGETPAAYLRKRRLTEAAKALLAGSEIIEVAARFGYSSQDNFTTAFRSWFGLPPGELRIMDRKYRILLERMKEPLNIMELSNLKQSPINTTLMACVKGASDYFELDWSLAKLFGYSSHAFMINIHPDLCPSSPYVWNKSAFFLALRDLGIRQTGEIDIKKGAAASEIAQAETRLRAHLDAGKVCILDFLEHQLIAGYDGQGFCFLQPWNGCSGVELPALSFGTMAEALEREGWVHFTLLEKDELRAPADKLLLSALGTAVRIQSAPAEFQCENYRVGDGAWEAWLAGIDRGLGNTHGHWWSAAVWAECRSMAADFFDEIAGDPGNSRVAGELRSLSGLYRECSQQIIAAQDKATAASVQKAALERGRKLDRDCVGQIKLLLGKLVA